LDGPGAEKPIVGFCLSASVVFGLCRVYPRTEYRHRLVSFFHRKAQAEGAVRVGPRRSLACQVGFDEVGQRHLHGDDFVLEVLQSRTGPGQVIEVHLVEDAGPSVRPYRERLYSSLCDQGEVVACGEDGSLDVRHAIPHFAQDLLLFALRSGLPVGAVTDQLLADWLRPSGAVDCQRPVGFGPKVGQGGLETPDKVAGDANRRACRPEGHQRFGRDV